MTVAEYDQHVQFVDYWRKLAKQAEAEASKLEALVETKAGVRYVDRDPGFDCWKIDGAPGYFATPRDAIAAKERQDAPAASVETPAG